MLYVFLMNYLWENWVLQPVTYLFIQVITTVQLQYLYKILQKCCYKVMWYTYQKFVWRTIYPYFSTNNLSYKNTMCLVIINITYISKTIFIFLLFTYIFTSQYEVWLNLMLDCYECYFFSDLLRRLIELVREILSPLLSKSYTSVIIVTNCIDL